MTDLKPAISNQLGLLHTSLADATVHQFEFNLAQLPEHENYGVDIRYVPAFKKMFEALNSIAHNHSIYWFSCADEVQAAQLIQLLNGQRSRLSQGMRRAVPVLNNNRDSRVLYVGARQGGLRRKDGPLSHLAGRIVVHLGYYPPGSTGGLQLCHWALGQDCPMTLNVIEFKELAHIQYLYVYEKLAAIELRPLCGKH